MGYEYAPTSSVYPNVLVTGGHPSAGRASVHREVRPELATCAVHTVLCRLFPVRAIEMPQRKGSIHAADARTSTAHYFGSRRGREKGWTPQ